jgi:putative FmdB family regulatory protein
VPTYQYACTECAHGFEQVQSFSDDTLTVCPECEGRLRKVFNAVGVVFKGSGFYRTDSRGKSSSGEAGSSSGESKTDTKTTDTKTETKTETKSDSSSSGSSSSSTAKKAPQPTAS